jgi:hypothetical protein
MGRFARYRNGAMLQQSYGYKKANITEKGLQVVDSQKKK